MALLEIEILDTSSGKMAEDVDVHVRKIVDDNWQDLAELQTDKFGRAVLADADVIDSGGYFEVLVFLGAYFDQAGFALPQFKSVDIVPLRFGVDSADSNITLHVAANPYGYSTHYSTETKRLNLV